VKHRAPIRIRHVVVATVAGALLAGGATALISTSMTAEAASTGRGSFEAPAGVGASVPFTEYEAEKAATNGAVIGPDITLGSVGSEASGRSAVQLAPGQYVEFTLTSPADAVDIAATVPKGGAATLTASVNGSRVPGVFLVDTRYTHIESYIVGSPKPYHFFSDYRLKLGVMAKAGDKVRVQAASGSPATIDLAQFEEVGAPAAQPAGAVSVVALGADPTGAADSTVAFARAIAEAAGRVIWAPAGRYRVGALSVARGATITGAGPWHTEIDAIDPTRALFNGEGQTGTFRVSDLAAFGQVARRDDNEASNFFHGVLGRGGLVSNVWAQNFKAGLWLMGAGNQNITIENSRFLDFLADGVNFNGHVKDGVIRNNYFRNQGDDALAVWSIYDPVERARFLNNTIVAPNLANGVGIYGGVDTTVSKNVIVDTNGLGSGIALSNQQFIAANFQPLKGTVTVSDNYLIRTGMMNPNWKHPMGAVRLDSSDYAIGDGVQINLTNNAFIDSPYSVIQFVSGNGRGLPIRNVSIDGAAVDGVGTVVVQAETGGAASFSNVRATRVGAAAVYNCASLSGQPDFQVQLGSGDSGLGTTSSGCAWPERRDMGQSAAQPAPPGR
jgi:hypothetical protein